MFIQGDLQAVFDALFSIGAIDPVLGKDWSALNDEMNNNPHLVVNVCNAINSCSGDRNRIRETLLSMNKKQIEFVAIEVAREFSEFQDRTQLH